MPSRTALKNIVGGWLLPIATVCVSIATTALIATTWASTGGGGRFLWWVAGAATGLTAIVVMLAMLRRAMRRQLERIERPDPAVVIQVGATDAFRSSLERAGLLPTWTPRYVVAVISSDGIAFLTDISRPFVFARLPRSEIRNVSVDVSYGRVRPLVELVVTVSIGAEMLDIRMAPLKLTREFVMQATTSDVAKLAHDAADVLGLPAPTE